MELLQVDYVLVVIGWCFYIEGLGLEMVGLVSDCCGMLENQGQCSVVLGVWVIGDVILGLMLVYKVEEEVIVCIEWIVGYVVEMNVEVILLVIYIQLEVVSVGFGEEQLQVVRCEYKVGCFLFSVNSWVKINYESEGFIKIFFDVCSDQVFGVYMIGLGVSEMIGEVCVVMEFSVLVEDFVLICYLYLICFEVLCQVVMDVYGWVMQN